MSDKKAEIPRLKLNTQYDHIPKEIFVDIESKKDNKITVQTNISYVLNEFNETELLQCISSHYWQLCPKCNGQGIVSVPPHISGDVNVYTSASVHFTCNVCDGKKIISSETGLPPKPNNPLRP